MDNESMQEAFITTFVSFCYVPKRYHRVMNAIGQRIKQLRKLNKLTQNDVAHFIGVQRVSVSKWESQSDVYNTPKGEHLFKLCSILKTTAEYLLYGQVTYSQPPTHTEPNVKIEENMGLYLKKIPVLDWKQLKENQKLEIDTPTTHESTYTHQTLSGQGYALPVIDDSMVSTSGPYSFPEGVLIIFDPSWSNDLYDNMFVIVKVEGEIKFRQIKFDGSKPYLNPLNSQYPKIFQPFQLIGKVSEIQMKLP